MKAMPETAMRLAQAHGTHDGLAELAQQHDETGDSGQALTASAVRRQNESIAGSGEAFPELATPHVVLSSAAGAAMSASESAHISAGEHVAVTAGANVAVAARGGMFASVRQGLRLFVHKVGMKLIAAAGDVDIRALTDSVNLFAKLTITQTANRITITAKEEIVLNGGGSYLKLAEGGIEQGSKGSLTFHGSTHEFMGSKNMAVAQVLPPKGELKGKGAFNLNSHEAVAGAAARGMPYRLFKNGSVVGWGTLNEHGSVQFEHELESGAEYAIELPHGQRYVLPSGSEDKDGGTGPEFDSPGGKHGSDT
jgi:type VI secretion system secreted protein VgrG